MENFIVIAALVIAVIISSIIQHYMPKVPLAFIQIALGMVIFLTPLPIDVDFETEFFMMGVIAPLLFLEANHVSRIELVKYLKPVILMAMGLVFTTVIGLGFITNALLPAIPIAAGFALAAIICPTDAVAVQAIAKGKKLPRGLMTILEGESLLNDAAGILSFNIALAALMTGVFTIQGAISEFFITTLGGILIGAIVGMLFVQLRLQLIKTGFFNEHIYVFIQLLTPCVIFLIAEEFHVSGIIAAVIGGIIHGVERDRIAQATTQLQMGYNYTWGLLSTALNGVVFVLLGYLVPEVVVYLLEDKTHDIGHLVIVMLIVALCVYIFRFIWVFILYDMFYIPESRFSRILKNETLSAEKRPSRFRYALLATICGVHGTISMAIALTLPVEINNTPFLGREELQFIAAGVVIISLVVAQVLLPLMTKQESSGESSKMSFREARIYLVESAIKYLQDHTTKENSVVAGSLIRQYTMQGSFLRVIEDDDEDPKEIARLQSIAMDVEMDTLDDMIEKGEISEATFNNYLLFNERTKAFHASSPFKKFMFFFKVRSRKNRISNDLNAASSLSFRTNIMQLEEIYRNVHYNVVKRLADELNNDNKLEVAIISDNYLNRIEQLKRNMDKDSFDQEETLLALEVINKERSMIQTMVEKGKVSRKVAVELRQSLNYDEMILLGTAE